MLSYTCKTAIKSVIYLASKSEHGEKAGMKEIAEHINASEHTVGKILQTLATRVRVLLSQAEVLLLSSRCVALFYNVFIIEHTVIVFFWLINAARSFADKVLATQR